MTIRQLQQANRLPPDADLYHPSLEILRHDLVADESEPAEAEARGIAKNHNARGFVAYESLKIFYLSCDPPDRQRASQAAKRAADCLARYEKDRDKQRRKRGY